MNRYSLEVSGSVLGCFGVFGSVSAKPPPLIRLQGTPRTDILKTGVITRQYKALNGALNVDNRSGKEPGRRCSSCSECLVWLLGLFTKSEVGWTGISKRD